MDKVVHFEIPVEDMKRAEAFYQSVFDLQIQSIPEIKYTIVRTAATDDKFMLKEPGAINGGMMHRTSEVKNPVITINVKDINEKCEHVKQHGGTIVKEPFPIAEMGIAAYFQDTEGNVLGLWQDLKH